ncbi:MFS transporter [Streptomyces justiciae]|uniref:MFS transporter n=1 Tax=Streptomyces justiciae TaxID=2780140 RepID=UPI00187E1203|nr:MFS transporter [Streptomyces justiciae]MBE8476098.1 MFS transporter [Streptomyces justiciae]
MSTSGRTPDSSAPRPNVIVPVLALAGVVVAVMQTLVLPLVPQLPHLLDTSPSNASWAVTATLLAGAVVTPVTGRLGDMYGKRRMLLVSLAVMLAGSLVAALSDSVAPLIVGRALQGAAAGVIPLGISIMRDELPSERLGSASAQMSASLGVGGALGLPAAALIAQNASWHTLFWIAAVLSAVVIVLVALFVPESQARTGGRFDVVGALGLAAVLVCLLVAVSKGADWGWTSTATLGLFASVAVLLPLWGRYELSTAQPLVDLPVTARRQVLFTNLATVTFVFSLFTLQLVIPQLMQLPETTGYGMGRSLVAVGLVMMPQGLVMMAVAGASAVLSRTRGPRVTLMLGTALVAAGFALNIVLMTEIWHLVLVSCVVGAGVGLAYGAIPSLIMGAVPPSETAAANSLNTLMRYIGNSLSSAVAGVVFAQLTTLSGGAVLPSEDSFKALMAIACAAALLSLVLAAFLPSRSRLAGAHPAGPASAVSLVTSGATGHTSDARSE